MKMCKNLFRLLCGLLCLCLCFSACKKEAEKKPDNQTIPRDVIYTVNVKTAGGMALHNVVAYVYEDDTESDLLTYGTLDQNGRFTFTAVESDQYTVRLANLPKEGYDVQEFYAITGTTTNITLTASVITGKDPLESGVRYELGDVMRDFTVTTVDGTELILSEILREKQAVVLNFWYTGCNSCETEFPLLQDAYEAYGDRIEVITMNPTDITRDTAESITAFRDAHGLTMPMATCSSQWISAFGFNSYPATIVIDRYGVVCLQTGIVGQADLMESMFAHFAAEVYEQKLLEDLTQLHEVEYAVGHPKNPYETYGAVGQFTITVEGGTEFSVLIYNAEGITVHIEDPSAYILYREVRYEPNDKGVIEVKLESTDVMIGASLVIGNTGVTASDVQVQLLLPEGNFTNPYDGILGENDIHVPEGNESGVSYRYVAPVDGVMTVTVNQEPNSAYDIQLYNRYTVDVRNLGEEELRDENGNRYISIDVRAGDEVIVGYMALPDSDGNYPALAMTVQVAFAELSGENIPYTVTVTDSEGNPMSNVCVNVDIDGVETPFYTDENGWIGMELPSGIYMVRIAVPEGYVCDTAQFLLTPTNTAATVVLQVFVPQEVVYTVYIEDETGAPVANVAVVLGGSFYYSDANGMVSVIMLQSNSYVATIVAPDGYTVSTPDYAFGAETTITVVLYHSSADQETIAYTVQLVDPYGNAYADALVRFAAENGTVAAIEAVGVTGQVKVNLPKANYTVSVIFPGGNELGYEPTVTKLTPSNTSLTIELVPYVTGQTQQLQIQGVDYTAIYVDQGSFYVDLTDTAIRFFLFTPQTPGIYSVTTTNANAALGYWGTPEFLFDGSDSVENNVYTFEVKQAGTTVVLSVSGGANISGTVLKINRDGDSAPETEHETYQGTTVPTTPFIVKEVGTKNYLDLAAGNTLVKGSDGYYHRNSADGPIVYVDLVNVRYGISIANLVDAASMYQYEYDAIGNPVRYIDYTECMIRYVLNVDEAHGVYALTDDLMIMLQGHGTEAGWYDATSASYLFGSDPVLPENAWMFLLCTFR